MPRQFNNRQDAGEKLAEKLSQYFGNPSAVVFAIPRGGVVTGAATAAKLELPLKVIAAKKIGHPTSSEYAIGAVAAFGKPVLNEPEAKLIDRTWLHTMTVFTQQKVRDSQDMYPKALTDVRHTRGDTAIIVDDGTATGFTALAAAQAIKKSQFNTTVIAMPVISEDVARRFESVGLRVVAVHRERFFRGAVGAYYEDFEQTEDTEVMEILKSFIAVEDSVRPKLGKS